MEQANDGLFRMHSVPVYLLVDRYPQNIEQNSM